MCPQLVPRGARILEGVDTLIKAMYTSMYVTNSCLSSVTLHTIFKITHREVRITFVVKGKR